MCEPVYILLILLPSEAEATAWRGPSTVDFPRSNVQLRSALMLDRLSTWPAGRPLVAGRSGAGGGHCSETNSGWALAGGRGGWAVGGRAGAVTAIVVECDGGHAVLSAREREALLPRFLSTHLRHFGCTMRTRTRIIKLP